MTIDRGNMQVGVVASTCILPTSAGTKGASGRSGPYRRKSGSLGYSAKGPEKPGDDDGQRNCHHRCNDRNLQDAQAACGSV
jgi:hypothetical protein